MKNQYDWIFCVELTGASDISFSLGSLNLLHRHCWRSFEVRLGCAMLLASASHTHTLDLLPLLPCVGHGRTRFKDPFVLSFHKH